MSLRLARVLESLLSANVCASLLSQVCIDFTQSVSARTFHSARVKSFWLFPQVAMRYFLIFPNDENPDPLKVKQTCLMLIQRPFPKVNCLLSTQIVPSTHYKFTICLIYAQSGRSCKYNAKSRRLELLLLHLFSLCNCLQ